MTDQPAGTGAIPFVWHPRTRRHVPGAEIVMGVRRPAPGVPERVNSLRAALIAAGHPEVTARDPDPQALLAVHDADLIEHLRTIHDAWVVGGYPTDPGQDRVVPTVFPTAAMLGGAPLRRAASAAARAGQFCYDTTTLIGPGTWDAVEAAAGAALTAVELVWPDLAARPSAPKSLADGASWHHEPADSALGRYAVLGGERPDRSLHEAPRHRPSAPSPPADGALWHHEPANSGGAPGIAYALCRPPGHHAARAAFGGGCYLNNAAIAADALRARGARRVAVLDLGALHGNGTQAIFYARDDVLVGSVHVDPTAGWFPHFLGFADETGIGAGTCTTINLPIPPRSDDDRWLTAVEQLLDRTATFAPDTLVVSLGVDSAQEDPASPLRLTRDGFAATGILLGALGLPTVVVQEAGHHLPTLGPSVTTVLAGMAEGATRAAASR